MEKLVYNASGISAHDVYAGPGRFVRFDGESGSVSGHVTQEEARMQEPAAFPDNAEPSGPLSYQDLLNPESETEPSKQSCPTGGCPRDDDLNKTNYWDRMEETAKKRNLDLSDPKQKRIAHMEILPLFRQQIRENRKYLSQDAEGPPSAMGPDFIVKNGGIYYPAFGKSLQQMYEDQRRLRPAQYDPAEHATMTLMEAAFASGATSVKHISHNKDAGGSDAIRDEITMVLDPDTGNGKMEIRNIAGDGKNLSVKEAYDTMIKNHDGFIEGHPREGIFILTDAPLKTERVHEIISDAAESDIFMQGRAETGHNTGESIAHTAQKIEEAVITYTDRMVGFVQDRYPDVSVPPFLAKLFYGENAAGEIRENESEPVTEVKHLISDKRNAAALAALTQEPTDAGTVESREDGIIAIWRKTAEKSLGITEEQSGQLLTDLREIHIETGKAMDVITFVSESDVAIAAGIFALHMLTMNESAEETDAGIYETAASPEPVLGDGSLELIVRLSPEEKDRIFPLFSKSANAETTGSLIKTLPAGVDAETLIATIQFIHRIDDLPREKRQQAVIEEKVTTLRNMAELWKILDVMTADRKNRLDRRHESVTMHTKSERISGESFAGRSREQESEQAEDFSFALIVWMLLSTSGYYANLEFLHTVISGNSDKLLSEEIGHEKNEMLVQREPAPWLLLTIIRQMSLIREQGIAQSSPQQQTVTGKSQSVVQIPMYAVFPQQGVIFVFHS